MTYQVLTALAALLLLYSKTNVANGFAFHCAKKMSAHPNNV